MTLQASAPSKPLRIVISVACYAVEGRKGHAFGLTVLAQEWRVAKDAVESVLQLGRELERLLEVVADELLEDGEALVELEKREPRFALIFARFLSAVSLPCSPSEGGAAPRDSSAG